MAAKQEWDGLVRRSVDIEIRALNEEERSIEVVASSEAIDSHGDVVRQFWDLKRFEKNGPVLFNHNVFESSRFSFGGAVRPLDILPIGKAVETRIQKKKLISKLVFGSAGYSELADKVFMGFKEGILKAVSIGFRPGSIKKVEKGSKVFFELGDEDNPNELFEISVVPMGSNPDAVAKSVEFERDQLRRLAAPEPAREREENDMDPKELQAELDKVKSELAVANAATETTETKAKAQADADASRIEELEGKLSGVQTKCEELTTQVKTLSEANAKYVEAEEVSEKAAAESDVDAIVGKKIAPTAREKWLAIRLRSKSEFDGLLEDMPELPHLKQIVPPGTPPAAGGSKSLIEEAKSA